MPATDKGAKMLRVDLEAAKIAPTDEMGRVVDFHSLRHTFITNLCIGGVHPKTAQALARHSTITLTMDRYTHLTRADLTGALDALPDLNVPVATKAKATGTDGESVLPFCLLFQGAQRGTSRYELAQKGAALSNGADKRKGPKTLGNPNVSEPIVAGSGGRTRTCDTRIMIPLL